MGKVLTCIITFLVNQNDKAYLGELGVRDMMALKYGLNE